MKGLYCILSEQHSCGRSNLEVAREILAAGVKLLQYREKHKSRRQQYQECLQLRRLSRRAGATLIINDFPDLALAVKADGVHLGQQDLPIEAARKLLGRRMLIGVSTHSPEQARQAIKRGADYLGIGPLYPTRTKEDVCPAVGLGYLDYAARYVSIPFVAIGGIKLANLEDVLRHGAVCVAMVSEVVGAPDIRMRVKQIQAMMVGFVAWPKCD
jgi:thiamine-phosphate pyrophosphorylase